MHFSILKPLHMLAAYQRKCCTQYEPDSVTQMLDMTKYGKNFNLGYLKKYLLDSIHIEI